MAARRKKKKTARRKATKKRVVRKKKAAKRKPARKKKAVRKKAKKKAVRRKAKKKAKKKAVRKKAKKKATKKKARRKKAKTKRKPNPAFMRPVNPDAQLAAVVGGTPMPRTQITKKLWAYIKRNGLQDTKNRRMINADANLRAVFNGKSQVSMFEMTKLVNQHLK